VVGFVAPPQDGRIARILDVACSIGQCTTALKQRFPQAEIWGLDVALPLVRYAHKRATDLGIDVHFVQALAEDTKFPDAHFDCVLSYILFHEVPSRLFAPILAEFFRVLRPGGMLTVVDAPNTTAWPPGNKLWLDFDATYNCEPYSPAFVASDFQGLAKQAGFRVVSSGPTPTFLACTVLEKPA
jgi:ubiquinone/menaquinone biosynthesis C-methylase UbiE